MSVKIAIEPQVASAIDAGGINVDELGLALMLPSTVPETSLLGLIVNLQFK